MTNKASSDAFGRVVCAMVTPFTPDNALDLDGARRLAEHLAKAGCDGLVISGTTGESPTTTDEEKSALLRAVLDAVGDRVRVTAGVGTNDTHHSVVLARDAAAAGAHGLLAVTPYYSKPPQEGIVRHMTAIADATSLPVMMYDIPGRTGVALTTDTLARLAEHPRISAVKDATGDFQAAGYRIPTIPLGWYSGDDPLNLPFLSLGAVGFVSVVAHFVAGQLREMIDAYEAGKVERAREIHESLLPVVEGTFRRPGVISTKAALNAQGLPAGPVRSPLVDASPEERSILRDDFARGGIELAS